MDDGERQGFTAQTGELRPELLVHCYRMMGSASEAEDAVQETYLRAWRAFGGFDRRASVRTWMYRIATNTCLNALGAASRRVLPTGLGAAPADPRAALNLDEDKPWLEPLPDAMVWQSAEPTPEEELLRRENVTLAWTAALQQLSPNQRAAILLRDVMALPAEEAAEVLGTSVASLNSALQRARAAVDEGLAEPGPEVEALVEREALRRFVEAFEAHDFDAVVECLSDDATWQMPPFDSWYLGNRDCAVLSWTHCPANEAGDLAFRPARLNGGPALGMYLRKGREHEAFAIQALTVGADGRVAHVTQWFAPHLFRLAGLPMVI